MINYNSNTVRDGFVRPTDTRGDDDFRSCDICDRLVPADEISTGYVFGLETSACRRCRGHNDAD